MINAIKRLLFIIVWLGAGTGTALAQTPGAFSTLTTTDTSADSVHVGCAVGSSTCTGGIKAGKISLSGPLAIDGATIGTHGIAIPNATPSDTSFKLYNCSGNLCWNGIILATGSSVSGTSGKLAKFTAVNAIGDSICAEATTIITCTNTVNATTTLQIGGVSINTGGTLSNVAYQDQANYFTSTSGQRFKAGIAIDDAVASTHGIVMASAVPGVTTNNLYNDSGVLKFGTSTIPFGTGTSNKLVKWMSATGGQGDSVLSDNGSTLTYSVPGSAIAQTSTTGTNSAYHSFANTGGTYYVGVESSVGGTLIAGTTAYAFIIGSASGDPVQIATNNVVRLTIAAAGAATFTGTVAASNLSGTNTGDQTITLTGDVTGSGTGSFAATLATVNSNVGSFGSSTAIPTFTVNGKGLITAASTAAVVAPAGTLTGTTLAANVVTSSLTTVGTIGSGTWAATAISAVRGGTNIDSSASSGVASVNSGVWTINNVLTSTHVLFAGASNTVSSSANVVYDGARFKITGTTDMLNLIGTSTTSYFKLTNTGQSSANGVQFQTVSSDAYLTNYSSGNDYFYVNGTTLSTTLYASGGVAIGAGADPGAGNLVTGQVTGSGFNTGSAVAGLWNGLGSTTGTALVVDGIGQVEKLTSSRRYKEHIDYGWAPTSDQLAAYVALRPAAWDYRGKPSGAYGFISEDLAGLGILNPYGVSPLVNYTPEGLPDSNRDFALIAMEHLVNAEQESHIAALERELADLKGQVH